MQRATDDIAHLYQEFGGKPQSYRELTRTREAEHARDRWPLISRVESLAAVAEVPPVRAGEAPTAEPLRWLAAAPSAQPSPPPAEAAERIEPTLTQPAPEAKPSTDTVSAPPRPWQPDLQTSTLGARAPGATPAPERSSLPFVQTPPSAAVLAQGTAPMFSSLHRQTAPKAAAAAQVTAPPSTLPSTRVPTWSSPQPVAAPTATAQQPTTLAQTMASPQTPPAGPRALESRSPLSRFAQSEATPTSRTGNLQKLFARLLGRDDS